jgi:uncharacterized repeat protein (TIGR01451 family)
MRLKSTRLGVAFALALVPVAVLSPAAQAAPDHTITLSSGSQTWNGAAALGTNTDYSSNTGEPCPATPANSDEQCEQTLLHVVAGSAVNVDVSLADDPTQDFDLYIYNSDASANRFGLVDLSGNPGTVLEVATIPSAPNDSYYLIQVVYFASPGVVGYTATAEITGFGGGGGNRYFLHAGGSIGLPTFDQTPPTSPVPKVAPSSPAVGALWSGPIPAQTLNTFRVDFFQSAPIGQVLLSEVHYEIRLNVGGVNMDFPAFTAPSPFEAGPSLVTHIFTPDNSGGLLPMELDGGSVSFVIFGQFIDAEATVQIYYDSVDFPSGFALNVPPPPPVRAPFPPDVDNPPGLQEILASEVAQGWTSRSEPHIAQNPVNPDILIAGSKFYNKADTDGNNIIDPLAEYEFKIGTYVSFDGGQSWTDLGQLKTCSLAESNQPAWGTPDSPCYPMDLPNVEGPEEGGADIGEEYITSDVWVNFDDEGNAYVMVLDHPPFDGVGEGNGWGMTLHRWESVSPEDVASGNTWSNRIPINFYDNANTQALLLDDKNTFAVNNAGPDNNGQTGTMIACWGQTASDPVIGAGKQQIVCERSTDAGSSWPGTPIPVSGVEPLVIGVHVVADTQDPDTFYVTWLQYATGGAGGDIGGENTPETLQFAMTMDGGQTYTPPISVDTIVQIPRQFPGQFFRNLSIPIMAVGPGSELYIAIAQYLQAPDSANDEDGRQADITLYKSTNGGLTWTETNITDNTGSGTNLNADQFQPYVAVTESGQVNVIYFDRRLDLRTANHPGNYFTDVYLSRSNDGGSTWTDIRLTHDATDPEFNAPVSPSGLFFGDYQGLVADDCFAIPFVNDTHLANDNFIDLPAGEPFRDRPPQGTFDPGFPHDPYQQAINWRVPNTSELGGSRTEPCGADLSIAKTDNRSTPAPTGRNLTYTVTVTNNGPDPAEGVVVTDTLPGTVTFVSSTPSVGSCSGTATITCMLGTLADGATATIDIVVKPTQVGQISNTATVAATTTDPNLSNNTAVETTSICRITSRPTSIPCNP